MIGNNRQPPLWNRPVRWPENGLPFDMRRLRYVIAAAEHLSFRRAAEALGTMPSSVSCGMRDLEDNLGLALFERGSFGVRLTRGIGGAGRDRCRPRRHHNLARRRFPSTACERLQARASRRNRRNTRWGKARASPGDTWPPARRGVRDRQRPGAGLRGVRTMARAGACGDGAGPLSRPEGIARLARPSGRDFTCHAPRARTGTT